jgi:dnd system-associated protein 4
MAEAKSVSEELFRSRIAIETGEKHSRVVKLVENKLSPFYGKTMKEVFLYAMGIGLKAGKKIPLKKKTQAIRGDVFSESDRALLEAIAISEKGTLDVLFPNKLKDVLDTAEEYANAGIDVLYFLVFGEDPGDPDRRMEQLLRTILAEKQPKGRSAESKNPSDTLKAFEEELRSFIQDSLTKQLGENWWKGGVPPDVRETCEGRKKKREGVPWLEAGDHPLIYYADFDDYYKIITRKDNWRDVFEPVFQDEAWIKTKLLLELGPIRNDIAHNRELERGNMTKLEMATTDLLGCIRKGI